MQNSRYIAIDVYCEQELVFSGLVAEWLAINDNDITLINQCNRLLTENSFVIEHDAFTWKVKKRTLH